MKKILLSLFTITLFSHNGASQCNENSEDKVLLVGDSWAFFMNTDQTLNNTFSRWGHSNFTYFTNGDLAVNGAETTDFLQQSKKDEIETQLDNKQSIEFVHLSIGGNDVLNNWNVNFTQAQTDSLKDSVLSRTTQIIDFIRSVRPNISIVWSGYMYPNFEEVIEDAAPFQTSHPFYGAWQDMGFPNFNQLNTLLNEFSNQVETYIDNHSYLFFVKSTALMQYEFGQTTALGVAPGGTYPPFSQPLPAGDPTYPSPKESMRDYGVTQDCFHLSQDGYATMMNYQAKNYYHKAMMDDQYLLSEGGNMDGTVTSAGTVLNYLNLGKNNGESNALILTFNTTQMIDDTLGAASIFLRRDSIVSGSNPLDTTLDIRVQQGNFGTTSDVDMNDYSDAGAASANACHFGESSDDGDWIRIQLPNSIYSEITSNDQTQFIIEIPNSPIGLVSYHDASNPDYAPVLNLDYAGFNVGIDKVESENENLLVYPNPTDGRVNIQAENHKLQSVEVYNMTGQKILTKRGNIREIDLSAQQAGNYILRIITGEQVMNQKVVLR